MKVILISVFVFLAVGALGGSLYGEKEDTLAEVKQKYDDALKLSEKVEKDIDAEEKKTDNESEQEAKNEGKNKEAVNLEGFQKDVIEATRSAIARGKPLSAVECIVNTKLDGEGIIKNATRAQEKEVSEVLPKKHKILMVAKLEIIVIRNATNGLKEESVKNIDKATGGFAALKADANKKVSTAVKQLHEIERRVPKPVLKEEYNALRKKIGDKLKEIREALSKRLQKCIS